MFFLPDVANMYAAKRFPSTILTCSNHFIDGDARSVQLLGKLMHSLARVLICVRVYVGPDTWQAHCSSTEVCVRY